MRILFTHALSSLCPAEFDCQPMGAASRSIIGFAQKLAHRGHEVVVWGKNQHPLSHRGVCYVGRKHDLDQGPCYDVAMAWEQPALLDSCSHAQKRFIYFSGQHHGSFINEFVPHDVVILRGRPWDENQLHLLKHRHVSWFIAASDVFHETKRKKSHPWVVSTSYPNEQLVETVDLWQNKIHQRCPQACWLIYSALLEKALLGYDVDQSIAKMLPMIKGALGQGIEIRGPMGSADMAKIFSQSRLFFYLPGSHEGVGLGAMEARASGLPVLSYLSPCITRVVENGINGMIAPDQEAFANMACLFLNEPESCESYVGAGRKLPSWDDVAQCFEKIVSHCL